MVDFRVLLNEHSFMAPVAGLTEEDVLDAALEAFDSLGYSATPVPAIAERAGVAVGSLYRIFSSKESMANALYQREKQRLATALFTDLDPSGPAHSTFAVVWERLANFAIDRASALCFLELHHHDAYLNAESRALAEALDAQVSDIIRLWQARGEVREGDPGLLHLQVFGGFVAVVRQLRRGDGSVPLDVGTLTGAPAWALLHRT